MCVRGGCRDGLEAERPEALVWGGCYIVCMPVQPGGKIDKRVMGSCGRYGEVGPNLRVKEVVLGEGKRRERYAVCHNPREAKRRRRHRAEVLTELEAKLAALSSPDGGGHSKQVCELRSSGRYRRYLRLTGRGKLRISPARIEGGRAAGREVRRAHQRRHAER